MTIIQKIQRVFPQRPKRMEKLETLQLGPAQWLHLIRVDGREVIVPVGAGTPVALAGGPVLAVVEGKR